MKNELDMEKMEVLEIAMAASRRIRMPKVNVVLMSMVKSKHRKMTT